MGMVVQHNLTAMNSNRMLGVTSSAQAKSTEKLSSGYKINRAADDAAGLSISEKMRKQIRGLTQASANAQDGISAVQTAEGALTEVHDMLQRMNELAVKAANGTNSESDRDAIQDEIKQLVTEIDRVAETTKFNETYLLKGDKTVTDYNFKYADMTQRDATATGIAGSTFTTAPTITFEEASTSEIAEMQNALMKELVDNGVTVTQAKGGTTLSYAINGFDVANNGKVSKNGIELATVSATALAKDENNDKTEALKFTAGDTARAAGKAQYYDADGNKISENALDKYVETSDGSTITAISGKKLYDAVGNEATFDADAFSAEATTGALTLTLHVGADATKNNQIALDIDAMSAERLGVKGLKVDGADDTNALNAIDTIKEAIQKVSTQRSALGAAQNRLEHTINNLDNVVENTTAAESQIRDTDMATEMVKYSNNNILAQAGTSMLAQANQSNQNILSLLG